jgi:citronellyl-CoA synthetase
VAVHSPSKEEGLISLFDYLKGWLPLIWRLPAILGNLKQVLNVSTENRESWGSMLEAAAHKYPNNPAIKSHDGNLTYMEFNELTNRYANCLIELGLKKGDAVTVMMANRPDLLAVYSAIAKIGAINAMINTNLRQNSLLHCLTLNPSRAFIVGEEVIDAFEEVKFDLRLQDNQPVFFLPDKGEKHGQQGYTDIKAAMLDYPAANPPTTMKVKPEDTIAYVYTSGTTGGTPKAAVIKHGRLVRCMYFNGKIVLNLKPQDTMYVPLPFFHTNALALSWPTVFANGSAVAIRRKFSVSNFWSDVRKYNATAWCYIGELCRYLMNQPPRPDDCDNPLTKIIGNGLRSDIWHDFKKRFGISKVYEIYGAAESNLYFVNLLNLDCTVGRCSLPYAIVKYDVDEDIAIRDEKGFMKKIDVGETGLLLGEISESNPFVGYTSKQATESKILRDVFQKGDFWFNTGDLLRNIGYGHTQFVDRTGDTFRWKGENVSTTEVEEVANMFPQISLSAGYGALMPGGDGRAGMISIIQESDVDSFDFKSLAVFFQSTLPSYAVPKFVRIQKDFEYTPTHKIKKVNLKMKGFDINQVKDPLFVLLPGTSEYQPLTGDIYAKIMTGEYRF